MREPELGHVYTVTGKHRYAVFDGVRFIGVVEALGHRHLDSANYFEGAIGKDLGKIPDGISLTETLDPICIYCTDPVDLSSGRWDHSGDADCGSGVIPGWPRNDPLFELLEHVEKTGNLP